MYKAFEEISQVYFGRHLMVVNILHLLLTSRWDLYTYVGVRPLLLLQEWMQDSSKFHSLQFLNQNLNVLFRNYFYCSLSDDHPLQDLAKSRNTFSNL